MSYQALARKYRPQNFQDMMGQQHVLQALTNALAQQRLHHAYLFTGTRGVGKTTIGRILAKCLNCETGITPTPCGTCACCQAVAKGNYIDLIEVDAASRTKVEDTRELLDNVQYAPSEGRFKIYLIDEVHMLSNHSFNALLKTLEEPPEHVKFILATTDPDKLPVTILSRCLQFNLMNMLPEQITEQLQTILTAEQIRYEPEALTPIAHAAKGSMRDALSLLDQAIAFCQANVTTPLVEQLLGHISQQKLLELLQAIADQNAQQLMDLSYEIAQQGANFTGVTEHLINAFHDMALLQQCPDIDLCNPNQEPLQALAQHIPAEDLQLYYQIALRGRQDLSISPDPRRGFQMLLLRLLCFTPTVASAPATPPAPKKNTAPKPNTKRAKTEPKAPPTTAATGIPQNNEQWIKLINNSSLTGLNLNLAAQCSLTHATGRELHLSLAANQAALLNERSEQRLNDAINALLAAPVKLHISCGSSTQQTPAEQSQQVKTEKHQAATKALTEDPNVQAIMQQFNAKLAENSIQTTE